MSAGSGNDWLPVDPASGRPLRPMDRPGYYPGYDSLSQQANWDDATRRTVLARVNEVPAIRFFSHDEFQLMQSLTDCLLPQDDRTPPFRIPVVHRIDDRLYGNRIDGFRYGDMPPDPEAYRLGLKGVDEIARVLYGSTFVDLSRGRRERVLQTIHDVKPPAGEEIWKQLPIDKFWQLILGDVLEAYYAHPYAWDEIGFGGPAYPRGYMRLNNGQPEPWEADEQRYAWAPPDGSVTGSFSLIGAPGTHQPSGQEGSH